MRRTITHACGHEHTHDLHGFVAEQEREAYRLAHSQCKACLIVAKRAAGDIPAGIKLTSTHPPLPCLSGSERQVSWAASIRARRLAAMTGSGGDDAVPAALLRIREAGWWIDHRDRPDAELQRLAGERLSEATCNGERLMRG